MRTLSAVALVLALAACDTGGPTDPPPAPGFEATVTAEAGPSRTIAGAAQTTDALGGTGLSFEIREGAALSAFELRADGSDETIYLAGLTSGPLAEGEYEVGGPGLVEDEDAGLILALDDGRSTFLGLYTDGGETFAVGTSGTVRITDVGEGTISGAFRFEAASFTFDPTRPPTSRPEMGETVQVEGTFTVERRRP